MIRYGFSPSFINEYDCNKFWLVVESKLMKKVRSAFLTTVLFCLFLNVGIVSADDFATVSPSTLDLILNQDETVSEQVSLSIHPLCIRPFEIDVVASEPDALVKNLTGVLLNGCGGDTSSFEIEFTGTGEPQVFDLQFVDAEFGGLLGSIPVTINTPAPNIEPLLGLVIRRSGITFQVPSSGCTEKSDFTVEVLESFPLQLRLIRLEEDPCDAFEPLGTRIRFSYKELGMQRGDKFRVVNPLGTAEVPPRRTR